MGPYILWVIVATSAVGGGICLVMAALAWRNRDVPAAPSFGLLMFVVSGWAFFAAGRMIATDPGSAYVLDRLVRITSTNAAPLLLVFTLSYTGNGDYLTPETLALLWLVPMSYIAISLTAPIHGLSSTSESASIVTQNGITTSVVPAATLSNVELVFNYALVLVAYTLLVRFLLQSRAVYRRQAAIITVGSIVPILVDVATMLRVVSHPGVDLTPAALGVAGIIIGYGLFRYDFLDVTPLAGDLLVDELPDPVFVLDDEYRILDHNRAAVDAFDEQKLSERSIEQIAPGLIDAFDGTHTYTRRDIGGGLTYYDPHVTTITDQHDIERGKLVVLRDVTGQQRRQDRLEALQAATQEFITAESVGEIAELTVSFADRVLDQDAAAMYLYDESTGVLEPTARSEQLREEFTTEELVIDDHDSPIFEVYRNGSLHVEDVGRREYEIPFPYMLLVPVEGYGVLAVGSWERSGFASEDKQFATILARTTQVALTQVDRETELRESRESIERRNEQVEFFNGVLRHTLRNALLVIEGRANHLRDQVDGARERHLDRIVQWCEDLSELSSEIESINDTVTATEAKRLDTIELGTVIAERASWLGDDFENATIETTVDADLRVRANDLVEKVIDSVVSNAIQHNDADEPHVEITAQRNGDRVQVRVTDNGPGMTDEMKETVFDRNVAASQTSHGFGLYFVSVMMNLYGGSVRIEDRTPPDMPTADEEPSDGTATDAVDTRPMTDDRESRGAVAVLEFLPVETQSTSRSAENDSA